MSLLEETKKAMGYTETSKPCEKCKYSEEVEDSILNRSWIHVCTYSNLCNFKVNPDGTCNKFEASE